MRQLSLFVTPQRPAVSTPALVASATLEPAAKIRVHAHCPGPGCEGMVIDWHAPIMSPDQMRAAGWVEREPNVWDTPGNRPCSRYCQTRMDQAEAGARP